MFLVKGGEDLRNDERIQQLFMLMNSVVSSNSNSSSGGSRGAGNSDSAGLKARTYAVIPMTSQVHHTLIRLPLLYSRRVALNSVRTTPKAVYLLYISNNCNCFTGGHFGVGAEHSAA